MLSCRPTDLFGSEKFWNINSGDKNLQTWSYFLPIAVPLGRIITGLTGGGGCHRSESKLTYINYNLLFQFLQTFKVREHACSIYVATSYILQTTTYSSHSLQYATGFSVRFVYRQNIHVISDGAFCKGPILEDKTMEVTWIHGVLVQRL